MDEQLKRDDIQANLFCIGCKVRECNEQSLHCKFRLLTNPNWMQKRQIAADKKREAKRAKESPRTRYWREWKREQI